MALLAGLVALLSLVAPAETLPGGFSDTKFAAAPLPTALAFTPDGRMLVTSKTGGLYVYDQDGDRLANPAIDLSVCANSERGLLGVAVDPDFETNNFSTSTTRTGGPSAPIRIRATLVTRTIGSRGS